MLDIKLIRENPELVKNNLAKRGNPENIKMLDALLNLDREWRQNLTKLNDLRHKRKIMTTEIGKLKKAGEEASKEVEKARNLDSETTALQVEVVEKEKKTREYLMQLPNLLHETVPLGEDDSGNIQVRSWGEIPEFGFDVRNHIDLGLNLDIIDVERAGKVTGSRFFYLKKEGVLLDMALMVFALEEMTKRGYLPVEPPYLMRREPYEGVTALGDFEEVLYKIENEDLYLIATSEHPMAAMFM
ncbi:MAG: serine--tRNA ligase, partial [Candidatus Bathyarchaeia archaeon]